MYSVFAGNDVQSAEEILNFSLSENLVIEKCEEALAPVSAFERFHNSDGKLVMEPAPLRTVSMENRRNENLPAEIKQTDSECIKLQNVLDFVLGSIPEQKK